MSSANVETAIATATGVLLGFAGCCGLARLVNDPAILIALDAVTHPRGGAQPSRGEGEGEAAGTTIATAQRPPRRPSYKLWARPSLDQAVVRAARNRNKFRPEMRTPDPLRLESSVDEGPSLHARGGQAESVARLPSSDPIVEKGRQPRSIGARAMQRVLTTPKDYHNVLQALGRKVLTEPKQMTHGAVDASCDMLNLLANIFDVQSAAAVTAMCLDMLQFRLVENTPKATRMAIVGYDIAGGSLIAQMAAVAPSTHPHLARHVDFVYCRKKRRKTGTCHQLEGAPHLTDRTPESDPLEAVWIDLVLETGGTLRDGTLMLKNDYNIEVTHALYLADDSAMRSSIGSNRLGTADPVLSDVEISAIYDTQQIIAESEIFTIHEDSGDDEEAAAGAAEERDEIEGILAHSPDDVFPSTPPVDGPMLQELPVLSPSPDLFRRAKQIPPEEAFGQVE